MRRVLCAALVFSLSLCAAGTARADDRGGPVIEPTKKPWLWVAHRHDATIYLYGTLHAPDERILAVPPTVTRALAASDNFVAEVLMTDAVQHQLLYHMRLPRNRPLASVIPAPLFDRVARILKDAGQSVASFEFIKPWRLDVHIGELDAPRDTRAKRSIDQLLYERARDAGKKLDELESAYGQIGFFDSMSYAEQSRLLGQTVERLESDRAKGVNGVDSMIRSYLSGDVERLMREVESYFDFTVEADVELYQRMHAKRNEKMAARLLRKIAEDPGKSWFVAIGAAHVPRASGLVALLELQAFDAWRVVEDDDLPESREEAAQRMKEIWVARMNANAAELVTDRPGLDAAPTDAASERRTRPRRCRARRRCRCFPFRGLR